MQLKELEYYQKFGNYVGYRILLDHFSAHLFDILEVASNRESAKFIIENMQRTFGKPTVGQWLTAANEDEFKMVLDAGEFFRRHGAEGLIQSRRENPLVHYLQDRFENYRASWSEAIRILWNAKEERHVGQ